MGSALPWHHQSPHDQQGGLGAGTSRVELPSASLYSRGWWEQWPSGLGATGLRKGRWISPSLKQGALASPGREEGRDHHTSDLGWGATATIMCFDSHIHSIPAFLLRVSKETAHIISLSPLSIMKAKCSTTTQCVVKTAPGIFF